MVDLTLRPKQAENGKWGYMNLKGLFVIPSDFSYAYDFIDGYAEVRDESGERGIINEVGDLELYPEPKSIMEIDPNIPEFESYTHYLRFEYREE